MVAKKDKWLVDNFLLNKISTSDDIAISPFWIKTSKHLPLVETLRHKPENVLLQFTKLLMPLFIDDNVMNGILPNSSGSELYFVIFILLKKSLI